MVAGLAACEASSAASHWCGVTGDSGAWEWLCMGRRATGGCGSTAMSGSAVVLWLVRAVIVVRHETLMYLFVLAGELGIECMHM